MAGAERDTHGDAKHPVAGLPLQAGETHCRSSASWLWCRFYPRSYTWRMPGHTAWLAFPWTTALDPPDLCPEPGTDRTTGIPARPTERRLYPRRLELYSCLSPTCSRVDYRLWTYLIGCLALAATAWFTYRLFCALGSRARG